MPDTPHRPHPAAPLTEQPHSLAAPLTPAAPHPAEAGHAPAATHTATRRHVVQGLGTGAAALALGSVATAPAAQAATNPPAHPASPTQTDTPRFFSPAEFALLSAACERIFPADAQGPGAIALGVPHFIDGQMDTPWGRGELWYMQGPHRPDAPANLGYQLPYSPQQIYKVGLAGVIAWVQQTHQAAFETLAPEVQDSILTALEQNATQFDALPAATFFEQLRSDTIEGAFADPLHGGNRHMAGWLMMGFPGARGDYMDWVDRYDTPYPYGPVSIAGETADHG
ncbi:gluconate 2-dehydrogenase subunit 3 family protein [Acetobacter malorum]|uniref:gluconate 2-dehydrogenase subunit 3 family protein n=1 Tax=Acetobacter malorum TaxID=178901 RepID=UPI0015C4F165|nr:gluconate 2-dehydrogenase subunit 3 family protein [Acetobacter malorum]